MASGGRPPSGRAEAVPPPAHGPVVAAAKADANATAERAAQPERTRAATSAEQCEGASGGGAADGDGGA
eukprot:1218628-Prymnesium_polylepis.1